MRRKNPISLKVKAPSRGLVTRLPSNLNDEMGEADLHRTFSVAQNVRFEDGVVCNAPGYEQVMVATTLTASMIAHWRFDEATGDRRDAYSNLDMTSLVDSFPGVPGKLGLAIQADPTAIFDPATPGYYYSPSFISVGGAGSTVTGWVNFPSVAAGTDVVLQKFDASGNTVWHIIRSGAALSFVADGAPPDVVTSSVSLSANTWYFFAARVGDTPGNISLRVNATDTTHVVTHVSPADDGGGLGLGLAHTSYLLDSVSVWSRPLLDAELTTLYNSGAGLDFPFDTSAYNFVYQANLIGATPTPLFLGDEESLFLGTRTFTTSPRAYDLSLTTLYTGPATPTGYRWSAVDFINKTIFTQNATNPQYWDTTTNTVTADVPGLPTGATFDGVESFFGHLLFWQGNTLTWSDLNDYTNYIPVANTVDTLTQTGSFTQPAAGANVDVTVSTTAGLAGGFYRIDDTTGTNFYFVVVKNATTLTLTSLDKTGRSPTTTVFVTVSIVPLRANEAGSAPIVGAHSNGDIFNVIAMGDYAYVFKERSVQSIQYVGQASGTFFVRTEVTNEGLLSRYAVLNLGTGRMIALGQRELYDYQGGAAPVPVCQQYTRQLFAEIDRNLLEKLVMLHREIRNEIWIVYPAIGGGLKVLIWNYAENTATIDIYDTSIRGLTAAAMVDWVNDPAWLSLSDDTAWESYDDLTSWNDLSGAGNERVALLASGDGSLLIHGNVYSRNGAGYTSIAETMDFDFDDDAVFKYVDVVNVGLQLKTQDTVVRNLYIQVGYRSTLDADITWTTAKAIPVQGNANFTAKVNPGGGGRYVRVRFYSTDADVQWRVSAYDIFGRKGGTY